MVWVECTGVNELDKENIGSPLNVKYTPYQGFPGFYFPYKKSPGYVSPIVAVQFTNLQRKYIQEWNHQSHNLLPSDLFISFFVILIHWVVVRPQNEEER